MCMKTHLKSETFEIVHWEGFDNYMWSLAKVQQTNVVKLVHDWVNDGQLKELFSLESDHT